MERSRIAIIIPALNEAATIEAVLLKVRTYGTPIVIDDGSTDATSAIATNNGARVIKHEINRGYDAALNSGFALAAAMGCEYAITMDADGQHDAVQLIVYICHLDEGYDLVLGVRDRKQRVGEVIFSLVAKVLWGIADPLCGMKGYRMSSYARAGDFSTFKSIGTELAVRTVVAGGRCIELPVVTKPRNDAPRFGGCLRSNGKILRAMLVLMYQHLTCQLNR